ncbi:molybdopterin-binding protein [Methylobacterium crusticola]|nr:molybdopterin-binding protein [Methylobacterium crusticola]
MTVRPDSARAPSASLLPLAGAVARLTAGLVPVAPEFLPPGHAAGAAAAHDVVLEAGLPPRRLALRDGWAVSAAAVVGASPYGPVRLERAPAWIEAGEALPEGTDALLAPDAVPGAGGPGPVEVEADAPPGEGTRAAGAEWPGGARLVAAGERLTALHAFALAQAGIGAVAVRRPRVRVLAAGLEAADTLSALLGAWIARRGGCVPDSARVPDDPAAIAAALAREGADAVLVIGGTGLGRRDRSAEGLARAGSVVAHGIALRPGESAGFGEAGGRPVLLLPGRPDAAMAAFLALGHPLVAALAAACREPPETAALARKVASAIGLSEVVFLRRGRGGAEPLGGAECPLHRLVGADAALLVPPEREGYPEGSLVEIMPL